MHTITHEIDLVHLDAAIFHEKLVSKSACRYTSHSIPRWYEFEACCDVDKYHQEELRLSGLKPSMLTAYPWKYDRTAVRQLTFNGQYQARFATASLALSQWACSRYPGVTQINLVQVVMDLENKLFWCSTSGLGWNCRANRLRKVPITLKSSVLSAFPAAGVLTDDERWEGWSCRIGIRDAQPYLGEYWDSWVRIPDMACASMFEFGASCFTYCTGLAWPYPDSQLEWLAKLAPSLNRKNRLLRLLRYKWWSGRDVMCEEHREFCQHLDLAFYKAVDGQARNVMTVYLLRLKPLGMEPPPVPFQLVKFPLA